MTISGIGASYSYGSYANRINASNTDEEISQDSQAGQVSQSVPIEPSISNEHKQQQENKPETLKTTPESLNRFVFDFKKNNEYNLVGATSKIEDLDVDKALSDMKKDSVLDQYKFFVKSTLISNEDGSVRQIKK